ncbi:hypothetical protein BH09SUM1_BH09SUM1_02560 [soil metagenome]
MKFLKALFLPCALAAAAVAAAQPYGIETRAENTALIITNLPKLTPGPMEFASAFPNLTFTDVEDIAPVPAATLTLAVAERTGRIATFPILSTVLPADVSNVLDLSGSLTLPGGVGLIGCAFDPGYQTNHQLYVTYAAGSAVAPSIRLSRFTNGAGEEILLSVDVQNIALAGGKLSFGPDDMLYIALGDGGISASAQDTTTLTGSLLRIDVHAAADGGLAYHIPADNPFFTAGPAGANTRGEIYAYGLHNPGAISFDRLLPASAILDHGDDAFVELNRGIRGANYGWPTVEGTACNSPATGCNTIGLTRPILTQAFTVSTHLIGGAVSYGATVPELYGRIIFASAGAGNVWALLDDSVAISVTPTALVSDGGVSVRSEGLDTDGEVYFFDDISSRLLTLRPVTPETDPFPTRLSQIPALYKVGRGEDQTTSGIIPFAPSAVLWSDHALKERFIALPNLTQIGLTEGKGWDFPENGLLIKNFLLPLDDRDTTNTAKRIETRLLLHKGLGWTGYTYQWDEAETDAMLLPRANDRPFTIIESNGLPLAYKWHYPGRDECIRCHTPAANGALGLYTGQMNHKIVYPASGVADNQLRTYDHIGLFTTALPTTPDLMTRIPNQYDMHYSLHDRARAYLAANCSFCHRPGGSAAPSEDFRWATTDGAIGSIGRSPGRGDVDIPNGLLIAPGEPDRSILVKRMSTLLPVWRMPPIASYRVDEQGVALLREWIESMASVQWMLY